MSDDETWSTRWRPTSIGNPIFVMYMIRYLFLAVVLLVFSPIITPWTPDSTANWLIWGVPLSPVILACLLALGECAIDIFWLMRKPQADAFGRQ
jgi:hypothetical protein